LASFEGEFIFLCKKILTKNIFSYSRVTSLENLLVKATIADFFKLHFCKLIMFGNCVNIKQVKSE